MSRAISSTDAKVVGGESDEGTSTDRVKGRNNPIYGASDISGSDLACTAMDNNISSQPTKVGISGGGNATYQLGYHKIIFY